MEKRHHLIGGLCGRLKTEMRYGERVAAVPDWAELGNSGRNRSGRVAHRCRALGPVEASREVV